MIPTNPQPVLVGFTIPQNSTSPDDNTTVSCLAARLDALLAKHPNRPLLVQTRLAKSLSDHKLCSSAHAGTYKQISSYVLASNCM